LRKISNYILLLSLLPTVIAGQGLRDSLSIFNAGGDNLVRSSFQKLLNTSNLISTLNYNFQTGKWNVGASENYKSTVISSSINTISDEHLFNISAAYTFKPYLSAGAAVRHSLYSGDKRLTINETSFLNSLMFLKYTPLNEITISPFGGYSINKQVGEEDSGPMYGVEGNINGYMIEDTKINSRLKFINEDISPRRNLIRLFRASADNKIKSSFRNNLGVYYSLNRKDFYFAADSIVADEFNVTNNIQGRAETNYFVEDRFTMRDNSPFSLMLNGRVSQKNVDRNTRYVSHDNITTSSFDSEIDEFRLDFQSVVGYRQIDYFGSFKIAYSEREENHSAKPIEGANEIIFDERQRLEESKSNRSTFITLAFAGGYDFSDKDHFSASLFHRKFIYDTPSIENFDDRDELLSTVAISYLRNINPFFDLFVRLDGSQNHIAYIFAERSANNNRNRSLRLQGGGVYRGMNVLSKNSAEVSANYTTYDFEDLNPNLKSFSYRQFAFKDSSVLKLFHNLNFEALGYLKLSEQADFNWAEFSGKPARFLEEIYIQPRFSATVFQAYAAIGVRYFTLKTFGYTKENVKTKQTDYRSVGPLTEIRYYAFERLMINLYGYYEFIRNEKNTNSERVNFYLTVNWLL